MEFSVFIVIEFDLIGLQEELIIGSFYNFLGDFKIWLGLRRIVLKFEKFIFMWEIVK